MEFIKNGGWITILFAIGILIAYLYEWYKYYGAKGVATGIVAAPAAIFMMILGLCALLTIIAVAITFLGAIFVH